MAEKNKLYALLAGKKTYIVLAAAAVIWFAEAANLVVIGTLENLLPILIMAGGATVTDKLNRMVSK